MSAGSDSLIIVWYLRIRLDTYRTAFAARHHRCANRAWLRCLPL